MIKEGIVNSRRRCNYHYQRWLRVLLNPPNKVLSYWTDGVNHVRTSAARAECPVEVPVSAERGKIQVFSLKRVPVQARPRAVRGV